MKKFLKLASLTLVLGAVQAVIPSSALAVQSTPSQANFHGQVVDLAHGWADARACVELGGTTECFGSEAELLSAHPDLRDVANSPLRSVTAQSPAAPRSVTTATCSTSLALYRGTSFTGSVLFLTSRGVIFNLSLFGFDNDTSSYKVGACSSSFYSSSNAGGSVYPGNTSANASSSVMSSGWDNVVSSVFIS